MLRSRLFRLILCSFLVVCLLIQTAIADSYVTTEFFQLSVMRSVTAQGKYYGSNSVSMLGVTESAYDSVVINGTSYNNIFSSFLTSSSSDPSASPYYIDEITNLRIPLGLTILSGERYRIMFYFVERGYLSAAGYESIYFTLNNSSYISLASGSISYSTLQTPSFDNSYLSRIYIDGDFSSVIEFLPPFIGTFTESTYLNSDTSNLYIHPIIFDFYNESDNDMFLNFINLDLSLSRDIEIPYYKGSFNRTLGFGGIFNSLGQSFGSGSGSSSGSSSGGSSVDLSLTNSYLSSQLAKLNDIGIVLNNIYTLENTLNSNLESILQAILSISGDSTQSSILDQVTELTDKVVDLDAEAQEKLDTMDDKLQESKDKLESMQEQLSRLEGLSESQISDISCKVQVGSQQASSAVVENTFGTIFQDTNMIMPMMILVFSTASVGFILFGKK